MKIFLIVALFFLTASSYAQEVRIKLQNCTLDKDTLQVIQNSLLFQVDFYTVIFGETTTSSFKARIFGTKKEFLSFSKKEVDFNPERDQTVAFFDRGLKEMIMHAEIDDFTATFAHELNHAILHDYCPKIPTWLNEGLSKFFEGIVLVDSVYSFDIAEFSRNVTGVRRLFLEGYSIAKPIESKNFYKRPNTDNYRLSWAVVYYLYYSHRNVLFKLIAESCDERFESIETLDLIYPGGYELLGIDVRSFFLNLDITANRSRTDDSVR